MSTNLNQASHEWATRPADQRFWDLNEMQTATAFHRSTATERTVDFSTVRLDSPITDDSILFVDDSEDAPIRRSRIGHYAFGQLCRTFEAPASYLRSLPASLAVDCLENGRRRWVQDSSNTTRQLLYQGTSDRESTLRAATSESYVRVWNTEIVQRLQGLASEGWVVPSARPVGAITSRDRIATEADVIDYGKESALTVKVGDMITPSGLYASDHDMFAFMIHPDVVINDNQSPHGLRRGTMIRQSEVGDCAIWKLDFLFNTVCGNHIVWDASQIKETRVRHIGKGVQENWQAMVKSISTYAQGSANEQESKIREAQELILGNSRDEVLDLLFGKRIVTKKDAGRAYDLAEEFEAVHGNPRSMWGMVQGITRLSQQTAYADSRARLDFAAGKMLAGAISLN